MIWTLIFVDFVGKSFKGNSVQEHKKKVEEIEGNPHCRNCGSINPEMIQYTSEHKEGLTECCHEIICKSEEQYEFGDVKTVVKACCWAMAEVRFKLDGIDINNLENIRRFSSDD
jgi:hypothetical protein